jgi:hypothetical protein
LPERQVGSAEHEQLEQVVSLETRKLKLRGGSGFVVLVVVVLAAGCRFIAERWWIFASGFGLPGFEEILLTPLCLCSMS